MPDFDRDRVRRLIDLLRPDRLTRVVDVGANPVHRPAYADLLDLGGCEVWGFEPLPDAFAALTAAARPGEHVLPHAIGDGTPGTFHVLASGPFSSMLPPNPAVLDHLGRWHAAMAVTRTMDITTRRLDDLRDLPPPDLLKIDVQGGELAVFRHGRTKLAEAVAVITEVAFVPLYKDQPLFWQQAQELAGQGFDLTQFLSLKAKMLGGSPGADRLDWRRHQSRLIDGDALFVRRLVDDAAWSDDMLRHLAILADAVFGQFDLALKAMAGLDRRGALGPSAALDAYVAAIPGQKPPRKPAPSTLPAPAR
jgi:FkbM family methyltransferase